MSSLPVDPVGQELREALLAISRQGQLQYRLAIAGDDAIMPSLSLRGIPEDTYEGLRQLAARNHRSMQE